MVRSVTVDGRKTVWRNVAGHKEQNILSHNCPALSALARSAVPHKDLVVTESAPSISGTSAGRTMAAGTRAIVMVFLHTALHHTTNLTRQCVVKSLSAMKG